MSVAVIYIPGLGDGYDRARQLAVRYWNSDAVTVCFVAMKWSRKTESFEQKYERIMEVARVARQTNEKIVLVGESAGGAMALYTLRQAGSAIDYVVTVCGYNHGASGLARYHETAHPAFYALMPRVDEIVGTMTADERRKITTVYSRLDRVVTPDHTLIVGADARSSTIPGHGLSIAWMLVRKLPTQVAQQSVY